PSDQVVYERAPPPDRGPPPEAVMQGIGIGVGIGLGMGMGGRGGGDHYRGDRRY
ncbi:caspase family protein, partial [Bradyrhizobium sp. PRIMUS42]|nr:caspase family protein [Bradyrhizobium sp. PRIMUS42]